MSYISNEPSGLGQLPTGAQAGLAVAATGASFIPVVGPVIGGVIGLFSKIFGGQKKTYPTRAQRAAGTMQAIANALTNFPSELDSFVTGELNTLFSVGLSEARQCRLYLVWPPSVARTFIHSPPSAFVKKRAIAAMQGYQNAAASFLPLLLTDEQWIQVYHTIGFAPILNAATIAAQMCGRGAPPRMMDVIMQVPQVQSLVQQAQAAVVTAAQPAPSGAPTITPAPSGGAVALTPLTPSGAVLTPGQAPVLSTMLPVTQAGITGSTLGMLALGGLFLGIMLSGKRRTKSGHKKYQHLKGRRMR